MTESLTSSLPGELRRAADAVRNWGRWGDDDQFGTLNFLTPETTLASAELVRQGKTFSLGVNFDTSGPQGLFPTRTNPLHFVTVDAGCDLTSPPLATASAEFVAGTHAAGPARYNDDYVVMPLQAATQWDALSHVYYDGTLYNGVPASAVSTLGAARLGIETIAPKGVVGRGVLIDVARHRGVDVVPADEAIGPDELDAVLSAQGVRLRSGDIVIVRTGWWERFAADRDRAAPVPGIGWRCAEWLHDHEIAAVAADNLQVEPILTEPDSIPMALHCLAIRDMGMMLGEFWDLGELGADCAADGVYEFQLIAPPLKVTGAVGTPLNPVALK